ncbi:MAG TPA: hypothetical protein VHJ38_14120 [Nitrososphaeraceae archaeon]|nr:hypothetical protein [Nitrososphaeraceae archaeon]
MSPRKVRARRVARHFCLYSISKNQVANRIRNFVTFRIRITIKMRISPIYYTIRNAVSFKAELKFMVTRILFFIEIELIV